MPTWKAALRRQPTHVPDAEARTPRTPSGRLKKLLSAVVGSPYDRDPCPHVLRSADLIGDPARPGDVHRRRTRLTYAPCVRPAGHVRESRVIPDKHGGEALVVPDDAARLHATDDGRVWQ